jgi:hypothetical protein
MGPECERIQIPPRSFALARFGDPQPGAAGAVRCWRRPGCHWLRLAAGAGNEGGDDVGGMAAKETLARSQRMVVRGSEWEAASWTSRSGTPASRGGGYEGVA